MTRTTETHGPDTREPIEAEPTRRGDEPSQSAKGCPWCTPEKT